MRPRLQRESKTLRDVRAEWLEHNTLRTTDFLESQIESSLAADELRKPYLSLLRHSP